MKIDGKLIISVTHRIQPQFISSYDRIIIMENGQIKHEGYHAEIMNELKPYITGNEAS